MRKITENVLHAHEKQWKKGTINDVMRIIDLSRKQTIKLCKKAQFCVDETNLKDICLDFALSTQETTGFINYWTYSDDDRD